MSIVVCVNPIEFSAYRDVDPVSLDGIVLQSLLWPVGLGVAGGVLRRDDKVSVPLSMSDYESRGGRGIW